MEPMSEALSIYLLFKTIGMMGTILGLILSIFTRAVADANKELEPTFTFTLGISAGFFFTFLVSLLIIPPN